MYKIKKLRVKFSIPDIFEKDEILVEDENCYDLYKSETKPFNEPINIRTVLEYFEFNEVFEKIE